MNNIPQGFIEVHCLNDGKRALIRTDLISAVYEEGEKHEPYGVKPAHTDICYDDNKSVDVIEDIETIADKMVLSEL